MHKIRYALFILLVSMTMTITLPPGVGRASGSPTSTSNGQVLDLTVFFDDAKQIQSNWIYNFNDSHKMRVLAP